MSANDISPLSESREVILDAEPVELYKILKFEALVGTGGEAKVVIGDGLVYVNGEQETRRRRKIFRDDVIEYDNVSLKMVVDSNAT